MRQRTFRSRLEDFFQLSRVNTFVGHLSQTEKKERKRESLKTKETNDWETD